jgi:hypothetical protein
MGQVLSDVRKMGLLNHGPTRMKLFWAYRPGEKHGYKGAMTFFLTPGL